IGPIERISAIHASDERKAMDGAAILAEAVGIAPQIHPALGENGRSATGFLPPREFEATADLFFAHPDESIRGWERACDAQARIVAAVTDILTTHQGGGDVAIIAHGGVGALLLAHLKGVPISRDWDQPANGGGNFFAFRPDMARVLHGWRSIDELSDAHT
ncbi:MAG: histidine phosphatase family protein, partial [Pseudomonadota bacterium]